VGCSCPRILFKHSWLFIGASLTKKKRFMTSTPCLCDHFQWSQTFPPLSQPFLRVDHFKQTLENLRAKLTEKFYHWSNIDELAFKVTWPYKFFSMIRRKNLKNIERLAALLSLSLLHYHIYFICSLTRSKLLKTNGMKQICFWNNWWRHWQLKNSWWLNKNKYRACETHECNRGGEKN